MLNTTFPSKSVVGVMTTDAVDDVVGPVFDVADTAPEDHPPNVIVIVPAVLFVIVHVIWYLVALIAAKELSSAVVLPVVCVHPVAKSPVQSVEVQPDEVSNSADKGADSSAAVDFCVSCTAGFVVPIPNLPFVVHLPASNPLPVLKVM